MRSYGSRGSRRGVEERRSPPFLGVGVPSFVPSNVGGKGGRARVAIFFPLPYTSDFRRRVPRGGLGTQYTCVDILDINTILEVPLNSACRLEPLNPVP